MAPSARPSVAVSSVERPDPRRTSLERVLAANAEAWRYFTLPGLAERAREHLAKRGIDVRALESEAGRPLAGHTPWSETGLVEHLCRRGFSVEELVDAGWASRHLDGTLADRYRRRLMIPVRDTEDRVVGVYGRDLTGRANAKYLNTPDTAVFNKGAALYRPSSPALNRHATVLVCEGSLDALAIATTAASAGRSALYAPVSPSGTAITIQQARSVLAIHPGPPVVCGDGDPAGLAATAKWATTITTQGRECLATLLPAGADPADWLERRGTEGLVAFTRPGRLLPGSTPPLRPLPAGRVVAGALCADALGRGTSPRQVLKAVVPRLGALGVHLPSSDAQARFADAAAGALAEHGLGPDGWLARRVRAAIDAGSSAGRGREGVAGSTPGNQVAL